MRVLVTGGRSLLARALVARLRGRGDEVVLLQRRSAELGVDEVLGDVADGDVCASASRGCEAVVHLAAKVAPTGSWEEFHRTNVVGTSTLVAAAQAAGVTRFVHVSTPSVAHVGKPSVGSPADPAEPERARGHYATSKAIAEVQALGASTPAMPVVAVRPHLVWGPGDTQLVGRIVARAQRGRLPSIGSGLPLIDTTYVSNAADALVAALDRCPRLGGEALVVSNGEPRTVAEMLYRICNAAGVSGPRGRVPARVAMGAGWLAERLWDRFDLRSDPPMTSLLAEQLSTAHWFDQRRTREALDWVPEVSLDEGFERLSRWYRGRP